MGGMRNLLFSCTIQSIRVLKALLHVLYNAVVTSEGDFGEVEKGVTLV